VQSYNKFILENVYIGYTKYNDKQIDKLISQHCVNYNLENAKIVRRIDELPESNINYLVETHKRSRKSHDFNNIYTLLIDNFKSWENFPKRKHALIATLSSNENYIYNNLNLLKFSVIPFDNAIWGVCPSDDIWYNWLNIRRNDLGSIYNFTKKLNKYYRNIFNKDINDSNFNNLVEDLNMLKNQLFKINIKDQYLNNLYSYIRKFEDKTDFIDIIETLLNPIKNGFEIRTTKELDDIRYEREIWTNSNVILKNEITEEN